MSTHRLSDTVADTVLAGDAAGLRALGRPDLAAVADVLAPLRRAAQDGPVQPTPALAALLEHGSRGLVHAPGAAPHTPHPGAGPTDRHGRHVTAHTTRRKHMLTEWLGGLGLAAKLSIASAVAAASVGVTGAAGALPTPVQHTFDQTVSAVTPFGADDPTDAPDTGIAVETDEPSDGATTDPSDDATPSDDPTPGTTDGTSSSTSAEPSDDDSASPEDEATEDGEDADEDGDEDGDHHSSASDDDGDEDHATSGRHRRHRGSDDGGRSTSGSRSDDDRSGSGSHESEDDGDHSGHGSGGSGSDDSQDDHEDDGGHGGDEQDD